MIKIFNKIKITVMAAVVALMGLTACNDYLDVVPDGGDPTLPDAFALPCWVATNLWISIPVPQASISVQV